MEKETFIKKLNSIPDLPTLPVVALKVNKMLQDVEVTIKQISTTIEKDPAMVGKMLKLVNSAFYGFRSKINTISHAITILGFSTVRNAIVSISVIDAFAKKEVPAGFDMKAFWKHAVAVAVTGRHLAEKSRIAIPDETFVAGILHDIGKLVLCQYFTDLFAEIWDDMQSDQTNFIASEKKVIPIGHAQIGGQLAKQWQLPEKLVRGITNHHTVRPSAVGVELAMLNHVADFIANHYVENGDHEPDMSDLNNTATDTFGDVLQQVPDWFPDVATEIEEACDFFVEAA